MWLPCSTLVWLICEKPPVSEILTRLTQKSIMDLAQNAVDYALQSCEHCKSRKTKCDKVFPTCTTCRKWVLPFQIGAILLLYHGLSAFCSLSTVVKNAVEVYLQRHSSIRITKTSRTGWPLDQIAKQWLYKYVPSNSRHFEHRSVYSISYSVTMVYAISTRTL